MTRLVSTSPQPADAVHRRSTLGAPRQPFIRAIGLAFLGIACAALHGHASPLQGAAEPLKTASAADPAVQEIVIELAIGGLTRRTVLALERDGELLVPAGEFFEMVELRIDVDSVGRLSAVRHPQEIPLFVDPIAGTAAAGDTTWSLASGQAIYEEGTLYLAVSLLEPLLDVHFHVDWSELRATVTDPQELPIARRLARERARDAADGPGGPAPEHTLDLLRPGWDGAVFDWSLFYPGGGSVTERTSYRAGLGLNVLGGSLEMTYENFGDRDGDELTGSWLGVWPERTTLRQLGLGDVPGTGPRPSFLRGAFVTNSPYVRPAFFDQDVLRGRLRPGWEVEVYRNGQLVDYAEAEPDGRFRLSTPLEYGPNPVELRAYGPYGEVRIWERAVPVQSDRLPPDVFEYGLSAGACRFRACESGGNLDLHYGLSRSWTVRGGIEVFGRDTLPDLYQPYAHVIGTIAAGWVLRGEALWNGYAGGDLIYQPSPDLRLGLGGRGFDRDVTAPILTPTGREREYRAFGFWRPIPGERALFADATLLRIENNTSSLTLARLGSSLQTGVVRWTGGVRRERTDAARTTHGRTIFDLSAFANLRSGRIAPLDGLFLRTGVDVSDRGFERVEWLASRRVVGDTRVDARVSWMRGTDEPFIALGITTSFSAARSASQLTRTPDDGVTASSFVEGSLIWNGAAGTLETAPGRSLRRGGLGGVVFLDANGNGRYDGEDRPIPDARVQVGPQIVTTDRHGRFAVWDLVPFVAEDVALDSMSLPDPLWVPAFRMAEVMVGPNGFRHLDLPVNPAAEVVGQVMISGRAGPQPVSGLRLELVNRESGRRFSTVTFHDGEFYVLGLPPGDYEVVIPAEVRRALGLQRVRGDLRFRVAIQGGHAEAPFLELELVPRH